MSEPLDKELSRMALLKKTQEKKRFNKVEYDRKIADWQIFYLDNLDIFVEEYLEIPLKYFQKQILLDCWKNDIEYIIASRGLSKSFIIGNLAISLALLMPGVYIGISSMTLGQSNKIIDEKIDVLLSSEKKGISPILKQLRKDKYIEFGKDKTTDARVVNVGNGSKIFAVNCGEGGRGSRTNISILDEAVLVKRKDYDAIVEPMLEPYSFNGLVIEPKQIFMTSAKTKDKWVWNHLKKCVNGHYKDRQIKYGFFAGDIFMAVANGIQTKKQYITRKENTDEFTFAQEFLNLWQGESENSLFSFDDFHKAQVLKKAFIPRNTNEFLDDKDIDYNFDELDCRYLTTDIALSGGRDNDNTVFLLGKFNTETYRRSVEHITTRNGLNSLKQVVLMKRLFYEYKCTYFVMDSKGIGNSIYDILTDETYDEERGVTYPAWTVCQDKQLQISSDNVINDKISRTLREDAEPVIIPIAGTPEINSAMHLALRKNLKDEVIDFLIDDNEMELIYADKDPKWIIKDSEYRADRLLPFLETRFTINESVSLNTEYKDGGVKVKEDRSATKDRYMTLAMFNYFSDKLFSKHNKDSQQSDFDIDAWSFLSSL